MMKNTNRMRMSASVVRTVVVVLTTVTIFVVITGINRTSSIDDVSMTTTTTTAKLVGQMWNHHLSPWKWPSCWSIHTSSSSSSSSSSLSVSTTKPLRSSRTTGSTSTTVIDTTNVGSTTTPYHYYDLFPKINDTATVTTRAVPITTTTSTSSTGSLKNSDHPPTNLHHHTRQLQLSNGTYGWGTLPSDANSDGIRISDGLVAKIIARTGQRVTYTSPDASRSQSRLSFHRKPDGADIFVLPNTNGHYVYMSNSERNIPYFAGVYGIVFDANHNIVEYKDYIRRTTRNCNGGRTPWNTWVTCEEAYLPLRGHCWQVDPTQQRRSQKITMSGFWGGTYEAFAYDDRNVSSPSFYITEDSSDGTLRRYRPPPNTPMGWDMLHQSNGIVDYLELIPNSNTFRWTSDLRTGRQSANNYYKNSEGIAITNGTLAFVSKVEKLLFLLNLDQLTYTAVSTETPVLSTGGSFDAQPDHVISYATKQSSPSSTGHLLFLTEDGGSTPGLFAYDGSEYMTILEGGLLGQYSSDEVTGLAFSPDGTRMYVCFQDAGILLQITRTDQIPFRHRRTLQWRKGLKL